MKPSMLLNPRNKGPTIRLKFNFFLTEFELLKKI